VIMVVSGRWDFWVLYVAPPHWQAPQQMLL
jgi:hypothetical protein